MGDSDGVDQPDLFGWKPPEPLPKAHARRTDPETSHEAAEALSKMPGRLTQLQQKALRALYALGGRATIEQCVDAADIEWRSLSPRFAPLKKRGFVRDTGEKIMGSHGHPQALLEITQAGKDALIGIAS